MPSPPTEKRQFERLALEWFDRIAAAESGAAERLLNGLDEELRTRVEQLLSALSQGSLLDETVGGSMPEMVRQAFKSVADAAGEAADQDSTTQAAPPTQFGPWEVIAAIGHGGMGRVFRVERAQGGFRQQAALKVLRWEVADKTLVRRFHIEREVLSQLTHPGVARLIDGGVTPEHLPYLVMEFVEGGVPIDRYVQDHGLSIERRLRLFLQVCDAVQAVHSRLVVHRDIKPSNVLVVEDAETSRPSTKLLDFGVSKILDGSELATVESELTTRLAPATPSFAAPEQLAAGPVTVQTDVYALGALLFTLLTGQPPFETFTSTSTQLAKRANLTPPRPSQVGGDASGIGRDLDNIVQKAMRADRQHRYPTAEAFAADVTRFLKGLPVRATPPTLRYKAAKFARRNTLPLIVAGVALVSTTAGLFTAVWQAHRARAQATKAESTVDFLESLLTEANPEADIAGANTTLSLLERGVTRLNDSLSDEPEVRARILRLLGRALAGQGDTERAQELFVEAEAQATRIFGPRSPQAAWARVSLANLRQEIGDETALEMMEDALEIMTEHHGWPSAQAIDVLNLLAGKREQIGDREGALRDRRRVLSGARAFYPPEHTKLAVALGNLGSALEKAGQPDEAAAALREAVDIYEQANKSRTTNALRLRGNLGLVLHSIGKLEEAEVEYRTVAAATEARFGANHPEVASKLTNLGALLMDQGRFDEALTPVHRAVELLRAAQPGNSIQRLAAEVNFASLLLDTGALEEAMSLYRTAYEHFEATFGSEHAVTRRVGWRTADVHLARGDTRAAEQLFANAAGAPWQAAELPAALGRGRVAVDYQRWDAATQPLLAALELAESQYGRDHWQTAEVKAELGLIDLAVRGDGKRLDAATVVLQATLPPDSWRTARLARLRLQFEGGSGR